MWLLALLGAAAGVATTLSGIGGAVLAQAAAAALLGARDGLAVSAVALLVGSVHRAWLFRRHVDGPATRRIGVGLVVGGLVGAPLAARAPEPVLAVAVLAVAVAAGASAVTRATVRLAPHTVGIAGLAIGVIGAAAGGAALLVAPALLALGLRGDRYVGTGAAVATVFNLARLAGYAVTSLYRPSLAMPIALLTVAGLAGNVIGLALRRRLPIRAVEAIELAAPIGASALALVAVIT